MKSTRWAHVHVATCGGAWQCHQASGRRRCSAGIDSRCRSVGGAAATILTRPQTSSENRSMNGFMTDCGEGESRPPRRRRLEARPETFLRMEKLFHRFPSRNVDSLAAAAALSLPSAVIRRQQPDGLSSSFFPPFGGPPPLVPIGICTQCGIL